MEASQDGGAMMTAPVIDRMFGEALTLLEAARAVAQSGVARRADGSRGQVEALRITARLADAVAWLMAARAVSAGEIAVADMARSHALDVRTREICLEDRPVDDLPPALRFLSVESLKLYRRLARLDAQLAQRAASA